MKIRPLRKNEIRNNRKITLYNLKFDQRRKSNKVLDLSDKLQV